MKILLFIPLAAAALFSSSCRTMCPLDPATMQPDCCRCVIPAVPSSCTSGACEETEEIYYSSK